MAYSQGQINPFFNFSILAMPHHYITWNLLALATTISWHISHSF